MRSGGALLAVWGERRVKMDSLTKIMLVGYGMIFAGILLDEAGLYAFGICTGLFAIAGAILDTRKGD